MNMQAWLGKKGFGSVVGKNAYVECSNRNCKNRLRVDRAKHVANSQPEQIYCSDYCFFGS